MHMEDDLDSSVVTNRAALLEECDDPIMEKEKMMVRKLILMLVRNMINVFVNRR